MLTEIVLYSNGIDTENYIQIDGLKKRHNSFIRDAVQQYFFENPKSQCLVLRELGCDRC